MIDPTRSLSEGSTRDYGRASIEHQRIRGKTMFQGNPTRTLIPILSAALLCACGQSAPDSDGAADSAANNAAGTAGDGAANAAADSATGIDVSDIEALLARGEDIYFGTGECWDCHGNRGRRQHRAVAPACTERVRHSVHARNQSRDGRCRGRARRVQRRHRRHRRVCPHARGFSTSTPASSTSWSLPWRARATTASTRPPTTSSSRRATN